MSKPLVYLCGPITGMTYEDARYGWRQYLTDVLKDHDIQCLSPMRAKDHLEGREHLDPMGYATSVMSSPKGITARDRFDTMRADLMLCNLLGTEKVSIGSMIEFGWADSKGIPIVLVMEDDNLHNHAMVNEMAGFIVPTLEGAIDVIQSIMTPGA